MAFDVRYLEFFGCFNRQEYYEAHEVLEGLWHEHRPDQPHASFYQALIQLAGAFTHLKLHYDWPGHHIHSRRLRPAWKLFLLAQARLEAYPTSYEGLDLPTIMHLCAEQSQQLHTHAHRVNPWTPAQAPFLTMPQDALPQNLTIS